MRRRRNCATLPVVVAPTPAPVVPVVPPEPPLGGDVEFSAAAGDVPFNVAPAAPFTLISSQPGSGAIVEGPDNTEFTYLGAGRLRYDAPPKLFLLTGAVSGVVDSLVSAELAIAINEDALLRSGSGALAIAGSILITARVVRVLQTGDVVELAVVPFAPSGLISVLTLQLTVGPT